MAYNVQALYEERYLCPALKLGSCNSLSGPLPRPSNALKHHTHLWSYYFTTAELFHHPLGAPSILLAHETRMRAGTLSHSCTRTHTLSLGLSLFHMHTHTLSLSLFHTRSHAPISQQHFWWCLSANSYVVRPSGGSDRGSAIFFFILTQNVKKSFEK